MSLTRQAVPRARALKALATTLVGAAVGFAVVDVAVGYADSLRDLSEEGLFLPDPECAWVNRPGFVNENTTINSLGLRSPEIPDDAPPTEVRILGTGPSNVYGAGKGGPLVHETWSAELERFCANEVSGDWRALNGGVMGYSTVQSARLAVRLMDQVDPDLVLVFASPGDQSLLDVSTTRHMVRVGDRLVPRDLAEAWPEPLIPLVATVHDLLLHSHLYTRHRLLEQDDQRDQEMEGFLLTRVPTENPKIEAMVQRTLDELAALRDAADARGVELRLVVIPHPSQFGDAKYRRYLTRNLKRGAPPIGTPRAEPCMALIEAIQALGIQTWTLYPEMSRWADQPQFTTPDTNHWSAAGHKRIGRALLERLTGDAGLIDELRARRKARPRS